MSFLPEGALLSTSFLTSVALKMSKKHEANPSTQKLGEYRKIIKLGSASSWGEEDLKTFRFKYERDSYSELPAEITRYCNMDDTSMIDMRMY